VPPYHPDYRPPDDDEDFSDSPGSTDSTSDEEVQQPRRFVRRGSEGYEVHTIDREAMFRQRVMGQMHEHGRYNVYVPEPASTSEEEEDETIPLAARVESWKNSAIET
jgi:palmitoyltransferase ZDHHC6